MQKLQAHLQLMQMKLKLKQVMQLEELMSYEFFFYPKGLLQITKRISFRYSLPLPKDKASAKRKPVPSLPRFFAFFAEGEELEPSGGFD
jgi:hypothetical protein